MLKLDMQALMRPVIYGWLSIKCTECADGFFGGEESRNAEMKDDSKEWWGLRDTQQGGGTGQPSARLTSATQVS